MENGKKFEFAKITGKEKLELGQTTLKDIIEEEYERQSPIDIYIKECQTEFENKLEKQILNVVTEYGIKVDKEELIKALSYDREQYEKGYKAGYAKAYKNINRTFENMCDLMNEFNETFEGE